jgi:hypothetical protein
VRNGAAPNRLRTVERHLESVIGIGDASQKFLLAAHQHARNKVAGVETGLVIRFVVADEPEAGQASDLRRLDGISENDDGYALRVQIRQQTEVAALDAGGIPNDGPVARGAASVEQMIAVQRLLVEPHDVEGQTPALEQSGRDLEFASAVDQETGVIVPLLAGDQQETIRRRCHRGAGRNQNQNYPTHA